MLIGALELAGALTINLSASDPAAAQRYRRSSNFFESLFGPSTYGPSTYGPVERHIPSQQGESPRAPPARRSDATPSQSIMVMGDAFADWLAYGLEEAFADAPEVAVVRKTKQHTGLIRYEPRSDLDWWHVARDFVTKEKADYVVMMLGVDDRQDLRDTAPAADKKADTKKPDEASQAGQKDITQDAKSDDEAQPDLIVPERQRGARGGVAEFRTEQWERIYTKRIDDTIAALKSKGVPVMWVGLPSIRGTRSTADTVYLNDLYRAAAEKAGIVYVDVWDGFVDEDGKFTYFGPDFEGQNRRLRSSDGVNFTKSGARKLAHYVEREIRRFMTNRATPMALPADGQPAPGANIGPAARPVAGPVVPLTGNAAGDDQLLGGRSSPPAQIDSVANQVLVKGEPVAPTRGRADDFQWPRGGDAASAEPLSPTAAAARAATMPAATPSAAGPAPVGKPAADTPKPAKEAKGNASPKVDSPPMNDPAPKSETSAAAVKPPSDRPKAANPDQRVDRSSRQPARIQQQQRRPSGGGLFGLFR